MLGRVRKTLGTIDRSAVQPQGELWLGGDKFDPPTLRLREEIDGRQHLFERSNEIDVGAIFEPIGNLTRNGLSRRFANEQVTDWNRVRVFHVHPIR